MIVDVGSNFTPDIKREAISVMVILIRTEIDDTTSNPEQGRRALIR